VPWIAGGVYLVLVVAAVVATLVSLATEDFDGLNNLFQLPLAFPWVLLPVGVTPIIDAWVLGGMGALNAALLFFWLRRRGRGRLKRGRKWNADRP
jgi:hypothetical protein